MVALAAARPCTGGVAWPAWSTPLRALGSGPRVWGRLAWASMTMPTLAEVTVCNPGGLAGRVADVVAIALVIAATAAETIESRRAGEPVQA